MATPYIMPLGFIDRTTDDGTIFLLTNPEDSLGLKLGTPVTVWRYSQEHLALAKLRGTITAVGFTRATFTSAHSLKDSRWPQDEDILKPKIPVYLAIPGSYEPNGSRMLSQEETDEIHRNIARRRNADGGASAAAHPNEGPDETTRA